MKKIVTVVGARPQFVKAAIVSRAIAAREDLCEIILHTGQHYDDNMSRIFLEDLEMPAIDWQLSVTHSSHGAQTGEMLANIESVLLKEKPDFLLIYGDTNSTLAGALAAAKLHIPVAHVEAGLRSWNRIMPEEINRIVADQLSEMLFAPTRQSVINLKQEGVAETKIFEVGDVMYDAANFYAKKAAKHSRILQALGCSPQKYILATVHRAENTDNPARLQEIFGGIEKAASELPVILPLHPRTRKCLLQSFPEMLDSHSIRFIDPVGFLDMVMLEKNAALIVTDSGGVQKEAFFYKVPCVTLREETEWVETVETGWNRLARVLMSDTIAEDIAKASGSRGMEGQFPYGAGNAAERIANILAGETG